LGSHHADIWHDGVGRTRGRSPRGCTVANKDKGGKSSKKAASKSLKEKRQAKKDKRAGSGNKPTPM